MQAEVVFLLLFGLVSSIAAAPREGLPLLSPGGIGGIFEGPDSETIIRGPDGSEITSEQKGGAVIRDDGLEKQPIVVAEPAVSYAAPVLTEERVGSPGPIIVSTGAPILSSGPVAIASPGPILTSQSAPLLTGEAYLGGDIITGYAEAPLGSPEVPILEAKPIEIVQQDPHIIETEIIEAPDVEPDQSSDLKGPSGRVITKGSASIVSGPASTTITEPRKIIVAPPKIAIGTPVIATATIPLREFALAPPLPDLAVPLPAILGPVPDVKAPFITSLPSGSYDGSSTLTPAVLGYSTTASSVEYGSSTTTTPLLEDGLYAGDAESTRIDLGANDFRQSIPVVEYSSSNGVINGPAFLDAGTYSSTEAPFVSSTIDTVTTDKFSPSEGPAVPSAYSVAQAAPENIASLPQAQSLVSSTGSPNVQKIPRIEDSIAVDGRVDMGYPSYRKSYRLPQILGMALSRFYQKTPVKDKDTVIIDDKMGELSQNEIVSYDTRQQFLSPPDLSQAQYISPALARNGIEASQVHLAPVPFSQVTRFPDGVYQRGYDAGYFDNRYQRNVQRKRSN